MQHKVTELYWWDQNTAQVFSGISAERLIYWINGFMLYLKLDFQINKNVLISLSQLEIMISEGSSLLLLL